MVRIMMTLEHATEREDLFARNYQYGDEEVFVADLGASGGDVSVDLLEETAIVVYEDGDDSRQVELELPDGEAEAFITNGVLTITVNQ